MKKVSAFQCLDGTVTVDERMALEKDLMTEIRGVLQGNSPGMRREEMQIGSVCATIANNREEVAAIIRKYSDKIRGFERRIVKK